MAELTLQMEGDTAVAHISGAATVEHALDLKISMMGAMDELGDFLLDVSGVESCDITFMQILTAMHKTAKLNQKTVRMTGTVSEQMQAFIRDTGFLRIALISGEWKASAEWLAQMKPQAK